MEMVGRIRTAKAADYRVRLGRHFAHKIPVEETEAVSTVRFSSGTARLAVDADGLVVTLTAADAEALAHLRMVIVDHLDRFAFRELPLDATWGEPTAATDASNPDRTP